MKSIWFFLGLLITVTIIFLSLNRTTLKVEYFSNPSIPINSISTQLAINPSRIRNFQETGDMNIPGQYNISFELHPRNIMMKSDPLLSDLEKKIKDMITTQKSFDIKTSTNQDVFLSKITLNQVEIPTITEDKQKKYTQFINPELKGTINYLKDAQAGLPDDPFIDPRYSFDKGKVVLNPLPTPSSITRPPSGLRGTSMTSGLSGSSSTTTTYDDTTYDEEAAGEAEEEEDQNATEAEADEEEVEAETAAAQAEAESEAAANDTGVTEGFYSYSPMMRMKSLYNW
jgi:hypothetical protein